MYFCGHSSLQSAINQYFNVSSVRPSVCVCVTDVASSYVYIANEYFDRCMRWDDFDRCVRWDALTADGIIMASNQLFERALLRRLVAVWSCKCKPCTAVTDTLDKLRRCALN